MSKRPELGDVKVGDTVFIYDHGSTMEATVTDVKRVWITVKTNDRFGLPYRFRLDTQTASASPNSRVRFATLDQAMWNARMKDARTFLSKQGITINRDSPWFGREDELANTLRPGLSTIRREVES